MEGGPHAPTVGELDRKVGSLSANRGHCITDETATQQIFTRETHAALFLFKIPLQNKEERISTNVGSSSEHPISSTTYARPPKILGILLAISRKELQPCCSSISSRAASRRSSRCS